MTKCNNNNLCLYPVLDKQIKSEKGRNKASMIDSVFLLVNAGKSAAKI